MKLRTLWQAVHVWRTIRESKEIIEHIQKSTGMVAVSPTVSKEVRAKCSEISECCAELFTLYNDVFCEKSLTDTKLVKLYEKLDMLDKLVDELPTGICRDEHA